MKTHRNVTKIAMIAFIMVVHSIIVSAATTTIRIYKENAGENGYYEILEMHSTDYSGNQEHKLECYDPGAKKCKWASAPMGRLIEYAENQIINGFLVGTYQETFNAVLYRVQWMSIGNIIEIQETQEDISSIN